MDEKFTELAIKVEGIEQRSKSNEHRINECDQEIKEIKAEQKAIYKIASSVENLAASMQGLQDDVKDIKSGQSELSEKVTTLENRPALDTKKRWDSISDKLLWLFIAGVAGFLLASAMPGIF